MTEPALPRVFCFLQGPGGTFFSQLAANIRAQGYPVLRVNFCAGDWRDWRGQAFNYRQPAEEWPAYIEQLLRSQGVTDLILLGEQRPYHKVAVNIAKDLGVEIAAIELGYLRPDWLTVERNGMSGNSTFPKDPAILRALASGLPAPDHQVRYHNSFFQEAHSDVRFHFMNIIGAWAFPYYRTHLLASPLLTDVGIGIHMWRSRLKLVQTLQQLRHILRNLHHYFVLPLQIENDYQIRAYSPYTGLQQAVEQILASFAAHAAHDAVLVIKEHPREVIWRSWKNRLPALISKYQLQDRVLYLDGGGLEKLVSKAKGVVTINSTSGLHAMMQGCAVKVLGQAIYDLPGMSYQESLDSFWLHASAPDPTLVDAFVKVLAATIQVKGGFYSSDGSPAAIQAIAKRLVQQQLNQVVT